MELLKKTIEELINKKVEKKDYTDFKKTFTAQM